MFWDAFDDCRSSCADGRVFVVFLRDQAWGSVLRIRAVGKIDGRGS
jgi:hypothetical protein